jgi:hypothetical protein
MGDHSMTDNPLQGLGLDLDEGRPAQTADMLIHPERTNLDEFLRLMTDWLNRARRGEAQSKISVTITGDMMPISELQQFWNGDVMRLHMRVDAFEVHQLESDPKVQAHERASGSDEVDH